MRSKIPIPLPAIETERRKPSITVKSFTNVRPLGCVCLEMGPGVMIEGNSTDLDLYKIFSRKGIQSFFKSGADTLGVVWPYNTSTI